MPRVRWGIKSSDIDEFDREKQFAPYTGPTPPNAVYEWQIKVLKFVAGTREKHPQLRIGLELIPREDRKDERPYSGYFVMTFRTVTDRNAFTYVPFCDAIGVSGREFTERTITDEDGNIKKIGSWRNDGNEVIMGQLIERADQNGTMRKDIGWVGPLTEDTDDEDDYDDEEIDVEEDEEEEPPARKRKRVQEDPF